MWKKMLCVVAIVTCCAGGPCGTSDPLPLPVPSPVTPAPVTVPPAETPVTNQPSNNQGPPPVSPPVTVIPPDPLAPPVPRQNANSYLIYILNEDYGTEDATITVPANSSLPIRNDEPESDTITVSREWDGTLNVVFFRFSLANLPQSVQRVYLNLYLLETDPSGMVGSVYVDRLTSSWTEHGTVFPGWVNLGYWPIENDGFWEVMNMTTLYQGWASGAYPNHGIMIRPNPNSYGSHAFIFGSSENPSLFGVPLLEVWGVKPGQARFRFPLAGKYDPSRVSGYRFGDPWEGQTCSVNDQVLLHTGTDFGASFGDLVRAVEEGTVSLSESNSQQGGYIILEHRDQNGTFWTSVYEHIKPLSNIVVGHKVARGDYIGRITPGTAGYGPHLHFHAHMGGMNQWSKRGRLPATPCYTEASPYYQEPALNSLWFDPETMAWE